MRKRPELPPELADAIEFTAEYRHAMGLDEDPEPITEPPSKEELTRLLWLCAADIHTDLSRPTGTAPRRKRK